VKLYSHELFPLIEMDSYSFLLSGSKRLSENFAALIPHQMTWRGGSRSPRRFVATSIAHAILAHEQRNLISAGLPAIRKPVSEARQQTPLFAKSIEPHPRDK